MLNQTIENLKESFKPFDVVTDKDGNVGFIKEVGINESHNCVEYVVTWLIGHSKSAWWTKNELTKHCNLIMKISENMTNNSISANYEMPFIMASGLSHK